MHPIPPTGRAVFSAVFILILATLLMRCGIPPRPGTENLPSRGEVWIQGETFYPNIIRVDEGTRVTWLNRDGESHTITEGLNRPEGRFESGDVQPGSSFSYIFHDVGVYYYYSRYHPGITRGVVIVGVKEKDVPF